MSTIARRWSPTRAALSANAWLVYAFFYAPIALLVVFSFSADRNVGRWGGFTLGWYEDFIQNQSVQGAIWVSVRVALLSTVISVVLGTLAALALLGMLNWTYQWYKPSGAVKPNEVVREFQDLFIFGVLGAQG